MDEAKALVHMSIAATFAAMLIAAAVGLISLGYTMWAYFSRQDTANSRMSNYSNYTAFDNTTVRGQEVVQLLESDLDVFVVIFADTTTSSHTLDEVTSITGYPIAAGCTEYYSDWVPRDKGIQASNSITTCRTALSSFKNYTNTPWYMAGKENKTKNLKLMSYDKLVEEFTSGILQKPVAGVANSNSYAAFKSVLVYEDDSSTDVAGIVLVRENDKVTGY